MSKKKSFMIHVDSLDVLEVLTNEQIGELFLAIKDYHTDGNNELSPMVKVAFMSFKNQFERDDEKYEKTCEARARAGSKGGKQKVANASKSKQKVANVAESKKDSDSDSKKDSKNKKERKEIIDFLNIKTDSKYKHNTQKTIDVINARINEGFTVNDFKHVIEVKADEWLNDKVMEKFLRPETLFSNKFESYLNQKKKDKENLPF